MLTSDHVLATKRDGELKLRKMDTKIRSRAAEIAARYVTIARASVGESRSEVLEAMGHVKVDNRDVKLADGLRKLVLDRCDFEVQTKLDPVALRQEVFTRAADARRSDAFDRDALLAEIASSHSVTAEEVERLLFADLKSAHRLLAFDDISGAEVAVHWERSQVQAVLLRAESVTVEVESQDAAGYRALFRTMKFRRLLYRIEPLPEAKGYRITIDGPFSLLQSVTKYGLQLALVLPAIRACDRWSLDAKIRWGKQRTRLRFRADGGREKDGEGAPVALPDEVEKLRAKMAARHEKGTSKWACEPAEAVVSLPGVGECVPDLVFRKGKSTVYLEVMGYWSRDAVFKRVELAEKGLAVPMLFAASTRLRVSEKLLAESKSAALYVYKGVMSAKTIEAKLDALVG